MALGAKIAIDSGRADRADSPWYPTVRLFRQKGIGEWEGVIEEVLAQL